MQNASVAPHIIRNRCGLSLPESPGTVSVQTVYGLNYKIRIPSLGNSLKQMGMSVRLVQTLLQKKATVFLLQK